MRRRDCVRSLDIQLVCARQMTMKCAYSSVAYRGHTVRHCTRASSGQVDVKPRKLKIRNLRFEREMKLVRLELNSNSQYFVISNQLAKQQRKRPSHQKEIKRSKRRKANREKHARKLERTPKWEEYRQNTVKRTRKRTRKDISIKANI